MKSQLNLIFMGTLLLGLSFNSQVQATIYGPDDRVLVDHNLPMEILDHGRPIAALLLKNELIESHDSLELKAQTLRESYQMCADESFVDLPSAGYCSGFLIAPDKLVTAGHCLDRSAPCKNMAWAFDFRQGQYTWDNQRVGFPKENVFFCKQILARKNHENLDYMVIELDRPVENRTPLKLSQKSRLKPGEAVFAIGFPLGLPMVWSSAGVVRSHDDLKTTGHLDVNGSSSGSPVFATDSGEVVGILVEGEKDLVYDRKGKCYANKRCSNDNCIGETWVSVDVVRKHAVPSGPEN